MTEPELSLQSTKQPLSWLITYWGKHSQQVQNLFLIDSFLSCYAQARALGPTESVVRAPRAALEVAVLSVRGKVDLYFSYQVRSALSLERLF